MPNYRTASDHDHQISKSDQAALDAYKKRFGKTETPTFADELSKLGQTQAQTEQILPRKTKTGIRKAVEAKLETRPHLGRRHVSLTEASRRGVDLNRLRYNQRDHFRQIADLIAPGRGYSSAEVASHTVDAPLDWRSSIPSDASETRVYVPPYADLWERRRISEASGAGRVTINQSLAEAEFGVLGAKLAVENRDAGNFNHFDVSRGNGFFIPYTMPLTGILQISAELICLVCKHHVRTWDEWGWSDFTCTSLTNFVVSVFWGHDDAVPMSEELFNTLAAGIKASGDGESYPGTVVQVAPGDTRSAKYYTDVAFPAGKTVWIYAGVANQIYAALDDVAIEAWIDTRWQLASLSITTLQ
jgi:hypothetical protein